MSARDERCQDIVDNCNLLLTKLSGHPQTDSTPEGRMISQLKWLIEQAQKEECQLPIDPVYLSTLRSVYTEGNLGRLAPNHEVYVKEWEIPMKRLIKLSKKGQCLIKPPFYPYAGRCITKLLSIMNNADRPLTHNEQGSLAELKSIRSDLEKGCLHPPIMKPKDYPCFNEVFYFFGSTVDDLPEGKEACRLVGDLMFEGIRPADWTTPEEADRVTAQFV